MSQKKVKYQDNYLNFEFTYDIQDGPQSLQCVLYMKTFLNSTIKSALLKQHLANAHPNMVSKNQSFFELKLPSRQKLNRTDKVFGRLTKLLYMHHLSLLCMW